MARLPWHFCRSMSAVSYRREHLHSARATACQECSNAPRPCLIGIGGGGIAPAGEGDDPNWPQTGDEAVANGCGDVSLGGGGGIANCGEAPDWNGNDCWGGEAPELDMIVCGLPAVGPLYPAPGGKLAPAELWTKLASRIFCRAEPRIART